MLVYLALATNAQDGPAEALSDTDLKEPLQARIETYAQVEEAVDRVALPENPTREQCRTYLDALRPLSERGDALDYKQADGLFRSKLATVPAEHADLLVAVYNTVSNMDNRPIYSAAFRRLRALEADEALLRPQIIANLENTPSHIGMIVTHGWCEDVREQIIKKVLASEGRLDEDGEFDRFWFAAAIELREPKLYDKLHELTLRAERPLERLRLLELLPDYDQVRTLREVLKRVESGQLNAGRDDDTNTLYAPRLRYAAARNGDLDALGKLIADMKPFVYFDSWQFYERYRLPVVKLINYRGSSSDIKAWFEDNRETLEFDGLTKRYVVVDDDF